MEIVFIEHYFYVYFNQDSFYVKNYPIKWNNPLKYLKKMVFNPLYFKIINKFLYNNYNQIYLYKNL